MADTFYLKINPVNGHRQLKHKNKLDITCATVLINSMAYHINPFNIIIYRNGFKLLYNFSVEMHTFPSQTAKIKEKELYSLDT